VDILGELTADAMYIPKKVFQVMKNDKKVSLIGKIRKVEDKFFLVDDTGEIEILVNGTVEENKLVRVFCYMEEGKLKVNVIQNLEGLNLSVFEKIKKLYSEAGLNV